MSQTVKISAGYSDKTSENYNSSQYSLNLELDVIVNGATNEIESASQKLFALCRKLVLQQRSVNSVNVDTLLNPEVPTLPAPTSAQPAPVAPTSTQSSTPAGNGNGMEKLCSSRQVKYLLKLAKSSGMTFDEIRNIPAEFKKDTFEALSSHQASQLIERYSQPVKKAA